MRGGVCRKSVGRAGQDEVQSWPCPGCRISSRRRCWWLCPCGRSAREGGGNRRARRCVRTREGLPLFSVLAQSWHFFPLCTRPECRPSCDVTGYAAQKMALFVPAAESLVDRHDRLCVCVCVCVLTPICCPGNSLPHPMPQLYKTDLGAQMLV